MNALGVIFIVALCGLVTWLLIDTIVTIVKKVKAKKENKDVETKD